MVVLFGPLGSSCDQTLVTGSWCDAVLHTMGFWKNWCLPKAALFLICPWQACIFISHMKTCVGDFDRIIWGDESYSNFLPCFCVFVANSYVLFSQKWLSNFSLVCLNKLSQNRNLCNDKSSGLMRTGGCQADWVIVFGCEGRGFQSSYRRYTSPLGTLCRPRFPSWKAK